MSKLSIAIPTDLNEAIEILDGYYDSLRAEAGKATEEQFARACHHTIGQFIRNNWNLWWSESSKEEKPAIVQFFNDAGISFADDISHIIIVATYRALCGKPVDFTDIIAALSEGDMGQPEIIAPD